MKRTLLSILCCLMAVSSFSQTNRYTTVSTSSYLPKSDQEIYAEILVQQKDLNKNIFNLINKCSELLNNNEYCYGDFRNVVESVKNRLEKVNERAINGFISIYDVQSIYNQSSKDYNKALKKHNKLIEKSFKDESINKHDDRASELSKNIADIDRKINKNLKDISIYNQEFVDTMRNLSREISSLKKLDLSDDYKLFTAIDLYNQISEKYNNATNKNIYKTK